MSNQPIEIQLYPVENDYIGRVMVEEGEGHRETSQIETVIIIDKSSSMAEQTQILISNILPLALTKLSYAPNQVVHLIFFNHHAVLQSVSLSAMKKMKVSAEGGTNMAPAIATCRKLIEKISESKPIRLLAISDGAVSDMKEALIASSNFADFLKKHDYSINSQAIRLFTSESQPDTTALASLLQVNNTVNPRLIDVSSSMFDDDIAEKIAGLFISDMMDQRRIMTAKKEVFLKTPWDPTPASQIMLKPGENVFWLQELPQEPMTVEDEPVVDTLMSPLNLEGFQTLMTQTQNQLTDQLKVLKVLGTAKADEKIARIVEYFKSTEEKLKEDGTEQPMTISDALSAIANDNASSWSSSQKAEYLKQAGSGVPAKRVSPNPKEKIFEDITEEVEVLKKTSTTMDLPKLVPIPDDADDSITQQLNETLIATDESLLDSSDLDFTVNDTGFGSPNILSETQKQSQQTYKLAQMMSSLMNDMQTTLEKIKESRVVTTIEEKIYKTFIPSKVSAESSSPDKHRRMKALMEQIMKLKTPENSAFVKRNYIWFIIVPIAVVATYKVMRRR